MKKNSVILIVIIVLVILAGVYLVATTKRITVKPVPKNTPVNNSQQKEAAKVEAVDQEELMASYKKSVKKILNDFEMSLADTGTATTTASSSMEMMEDDNATSSEDAAGTENNKVEKIAELKISLMDLTTPDELRDLHLSLVMALTKMKSYLESEEEADRAEALGIIEGAKLEFVWLGDN